MKSWNKKAVSGVLVTILILAVIAGVAVFIYTQYGAIQQQQVVSEQVFYGSLTITINEDNFLSPGTSVTTTSDSYIAYHTKGKTLDEATQSDFVGGNTFVVGTGKDITIDPADNGHFWLKTYTGTDYYLSVEGTTDANPRISGTYTLVDVDNDKRDELVFDVDISDIAEPNPPSKPTLDITIMTIQEDGTTALNSPADQTSIATGTTTGTIEWQITGIAEKYGEGLARIYVVQNETTETKVSVTGVEIDQVGVFTGGQITYDSGAKAWYLNIDINDYKELTQAIILERLSGGKSYVGVTVSWETYFVSSGQQVIMYLKVDTMDADETLNTQLTDDMVLGAT